MPRHRPVLKRMWVPATALLLVVVVTGAGRIPSSGCGAAVNPATSALVPFADLSEAKDQAYFSDGLTDELITALSRVEGLRVAGRTSSFQFRGGGRQIDVADVGRRLHVDAILEGSVRRSGNRLRITEQLVSTGDGYQLWSEAYDRELKEGFAVPEGLAPALSP